MFLKYEEEPTIVMKSEQNDIEVEPKRKQNKLPISFRKTLCGFCGDNFRTNPELLIHIYENHPTVAKNLKKCERCGKVFPLGNYKGTFSHHVNSCKLKEIKKDNSSFNSKNKIVCPSCDKKLSSYNGLRKHLNHKRCGKPKKIPSLLCPHCGKLCENKKRRKNHVSWCKLGAQQCPHCGKMIKRLSSSPHLTPTGGCPVLNTKPKKTRRPKPTAEISEEGVKKRIQRWVASYNELTKEAGEQVRRRCWGRFRRRWPDMLQEEEDGIQEEEWKEIRRTAGLRQEQMEGLMESLREKWGEDLVLVRGKEMS